MSPPSPPAATALQASETVTFDRQALKEVLQKVLATSAYDGKGNEVTALKAWKFVQAACMHASV